MSLGPAVRWSAISSITVRSVTFVSTIVLARLLTPADFGLAAIVMTVVLFAEVFTDLGIRSAVVQSPQLTQRFQSTAFWVNVMTGFLMAGVIVASRNAIASAFSSPELADLLLVGSLSVVVAINVVSFALLQRQMRFRSIAAVEITSVSVGVAVAIGMAVAELGAMSLIFGTVVREGVRSGLFIGVARWRPTLEIGRGEANTLWRYVRGLIGFNAVNYWARNLDNIAIGRVVGEAALGLYSRAYGLMLIPVAQIGTVIEQVLLPVLARQSARERSSLWLSAAKTSWTLGAPAGLGLSLLADDLVGALYGDQWAGAVPILVALGLAVPPQMVSRTLGAGFQALAMTGRQFAVGLVNTAVVVVAILVGLRWGERGVAVGVTVAMYVTSTFAATVLCKALGLPFRLLLRSLVPAAVACGAMTVAVTIVKSRYASALGDWTSLIVLGALGASVYVLVLGLVDRDLLVAIGRVAKRRSMDDQSGSS